MASISNLPPRGVIAAEMPWRKAQSFRQDPLGRRWAYGAGGEWLAVDHSTAQGRTATNGTAFHRRLTIGSAS